MTLLLLTAESATVFGVSVWVLLRLWARSCAVSMADVVLYDFLAASGHGGAATGQPWRADPNSIVDGGILAARRGEPAAPARIGLPRSPSAGPRTTDGGAASGFARSPLGAVVAAANLGVRAAGVDVLALACHNSADSCPDVALWQVAKSDGPDITAHPAQSGISSQYRWDASDRKVRSGSAGQKVREFTSPPAYRIEVAGWEMEHYSSRNAAVRYVLTRSGGGGGVVTTAMRVEVNWIDDDWRVVAPPAGDWAEVFSTDVDVADFTAFPSSFPLPVH